ncbi:CTP synthase [Dirofilaria immitis]
MGCQSSKGEHAKTEKSKLSKNDTNEKANAIGQPLADKSWQERQHNEIPLEKVTFSSEEMNDEMGRSVSELPINHNTDLKMRIPGSLILEPNEEITSNWKQSKKIKIHKHRSEQNLDNNKSYKQLGEKLNKKCGPNNGKQLQIRTKTKRSRANPEDDTLYEVPLKMPEFDLVPSRSEDSVA